MGKINVDEEAALSKHFRTCSIPTLAVRNDGLIAQKVIGARSEEQLLALMQ